LNNYLEGAIRQQIVRSERMLEKISLEPLSVEFKVTFGM